MMELFYPSAVVLTCHCCR